MKTIQTLLIVGILGFVVTEAGARPCGKAKVDTKWEEKADKNNDGYVAPFEARKVYHHHNYLTNKSEVDTRWEEKADKNDDGTVNRKELHDAKDKFKENLKDKAVVDTKWEERVDRDNDGKVEANELAKAWKYYQKHRSDVDKEWEKKADLNGDGKISHEEFAKARRHLRYQHNHSANETTK